MGGEDFLSGGDGDAVRKTPSVQAGEHHPSLGQEVDGMAGGTEVWGRAEARG